MLVLVHGIVEPALELIAWVRLIVIRRLILFLLLWHPAPHHNAGCILVDPGQVILLQRGTGLCRRRQLVPVAYILLIVKVLAPLDQVVHFVVEVAIFQLHKSLIVEWILVKLLQGKFVQVLGNLWLLLDELGVFCVFVEFAEPLKLLHTLFLCR